MIKVFRPFWSYDVKQTEIWLSSMAERGYHLVGLNRWTRNFFFEQGEPKSIIYRIGFEKKQDKSLSSSLLNEQWKKVTQSGNWYFLTNEKPPELIKTSPVRDGIVKHNRIIKYIFTGIFIYLTFIFLFPLAITGLVLLQGGPVEVEPSPMWILTYTLFGIAIMVYVLCVFSIIKINTSNKDINSKNQAKLQGLNRRGERLSKEKEKQLKRSGQMVVKRKFGWMYAPDKLEKWLETREEQGYNLYRIGKTGTAFYFIKGSPRKVRYCTDFQNFSNESYFDFLMETGWNQVYSSYSSFQKWTIWSREYMEGEERPQIYSDRSHLLKHARRVAMVYTGMFLPLVILYSFNILLFYRPMHSGDAPNLAFINLALFLLGIVSFGSIIIRIWLYYMRLKMKKDFC